MGAFVKKWFHLVLIFVFAYLAGSLAGLILFFSICSQILREGIRIYIHDDKTAAQCRSNFAAEHFADTSCRICRFF